MDVEEQILRKRHKIIHANHSPEPDGSKPVLNPLNIILLYICVYDARYELLGHGG